MNHNWEKFLTTQGASVSKQGDIEFATQTIADKTIFALPKLAVLRVGGRDAATFLQGQSTCNIHDVTASKGSFGAFCSAKGRSLCTFFIYKEGEQFILLLAADLLEKISRKLQMYILRADVQLQTAQDNDVLIGLQSPDHDLFDIPIQNYHVTHDGDCSYIRIPSSPARYIVVCNNAAAEFLWQQLTETQAYSACNSQQWEILDILSGIAWLDMQSSEEYIPQMLNLDQLDGISFNKGCYTGQEIIARTHYKGKAKRQMYLAESNSQQVLDAETSILDLSNESQSSVGKVLLSRHSEGKTRMLVILQIANAESSQLCLNNSHKDQITLSEFTYC